MLKDADLFRDWPQPAIPAWRPRPRLVRDLKGLPPLLAQAGSLDLRLATTRKDIRKAQRLRYHCFFETSDAVPTASQRLARRDRCPFDSVSDHLLVIDNAFASAAGHIKPKVVGTYRLIRSDTARDGLGFYSATEFDLEPLIHRHSEARFLELGRSCVHESYRSKRVIDLLWRGIGMYAAHHRTDVLIGCASLPGTDPAELAVPLSFAFHHAAAEDSWQVSAQPGVAFAMDRLGKDDVEPRVAMAKLPPLLKAYLRVGSRFAREAAVDRSFGCTDLFTVLPLASADPRYLAHFGSALAPLS